MRGFLLVSEPGRGRRGKRELYCLCCNGDPTATPATFEDPQGDYFIFVGNMSEREAMDGGLGISGRVRAPGGPDIYHAFRRETADERDARLAKEGKPPA